MNIDIPVSRDLKDLKECFKLVRGIDGLKHNPKLAITLFHYEKLTVPEIAYVMNLSEFRVAQLLRQAVKILKCNGCIISKRLEELL